MHIHNKVYYNIVLAAKRPRTKPVAKKEPVTSEMVKQIIDNYGSPTNDLKDLRIATICALGFAGFLRYNELCNILPTHVTFRANLMSILIPHCKTDIYREGNIVYLMHG